MFTEQALVKARIDLYNIVANHARNDYMQANYKNGKKKSKKHIPYTLSQDTVTAKEYYTMVLCNEIEDITREQEEVIKYYLLSFRLVRTEYIKDAGGLSYFSNSIEEKFRELAKV